MAEVVYYRSLCPHCDEYTYHENDQTGATVQCCRCKARYGVDLPCEEVQTDIEDSVNK